MAKTEESRAKIIKAAMDAAARDGWRRLSMTDIAAEANISLADLHREFRTKRQILFALADHADEEVLAPTRKPGKPEKTAKAAEVEEDTARDRLFDVMMRRFDALNPYKDGIAAVVRDSVRPRPVSCAVAEVICGGQRLMQSMRWMLEAADIRTSGLVGLVRIKGLGAIYTSTIMVWLRDNTEDMSKTMAALDRHLERAERLASMSGPGRRRPVQEAAGGGEAPQPA